jgi:hypothetical protein
MALGAHCPQLPTGLKMQSGRYTGLAAGIARECQVAASGFLEGSTATMRPVLAWETLFVAEISKFRDLDTRMAERRQASAKVRDLARQDRGRTDFEKPFLSPLGWMIAVILNFALVLVVGLGTVLVPPLMACREQSARGFFAGDSFQACAGRGISASFQDFDRRIRRLVLRSGQ